MRTAAAYAAVAPGAPLAPLSIERRALRPEDVHIEVLYCGVCHSDIHQVRAEWGGERFPMVPGHEVIGRVSAVGSAVQRFQVGDHAAVGCFVDSCRSCDPCRRDRGQFCEAGPAWTYNSTEMDRQTPTYGGYSTELVVAEPYAIKIPPGVDLAATAPLLCAGITTYSPLRQFQTKAGDRVGVLGLGGLGHMAVKLAAAMGAEVTVLSGSPSKAADARRLGAHEFVSTRDEGAMRGLRKRLDLIIDTVSAPHDYDGLLELLRPFGTLVLVGLPPEKVPLGASALILGNRRLAGSLIGGIGETQEMIDFCAARGIVSDIEIIPMQRINEAYERVLRSDVRYRFVVDLASLRG